VLEKPHYASAKTELEARKYAETLEGLLDQGIIPTELNDDPVSQRQHDTVKKWADIYLAQVDMSDSDRVLLHSMLDLMDLWKVHELSMQWAHGWVQGMKRVDRLSPSSIRHKVGAVARMLDWCVAMDKLAVNPLRMLPKRYASYAMGDGDRRVDVERDRRLLEGEEERIIALLSGDIPAGKERGLLKDDLEDWILIFTLALETAMRLKELYTLTWEQVDLEKRTVFLDKTKNGDKRQVPLSSVALEAFGAFPRKYDRFVFGWWDGRRESLRGATNKLSQKWARIARLSGCDGLHFHDLRHEAVCRLYERTQLSDLQIAKISGHKDLRMLKRYANLRGSDLAELLW